ncbi:MAG: BglII/BstYI family type II restriction endonuclease [Nitrospinota bacterium]
MPRLAISADHSHMFGREILEHKYPLLYGEIRDIIEGTEVRERIKISREKAKEGRPIWSGQAINPPLERRFRQQGWQKRREPMQQGTGAWINVDYCKEKVALEAQFGKYAFVLHDFYKFQFLFGKRIIDIGVEIVPSSHLQREMYTGPANFDSVQAHMLSHARNEPPMPIWLIGVDIK